MSPTYELYELCKEQIYSRVVVFDCITLYRCTYILVTIDWIKHFYVQQKETDTLKLLIMVKPRQE